MSRDREGYGRNEGLRKENRVMEKSDYKKLGLPAVRVVDVKGYEFAKVGTIARWLDVSADVVRDLLLRLGATHEIRVLPLSERLNLINVSDFYRALLDCVPMRSGWAKGMK